MGRCVQRTEVHIPIVRSITSRRSCTSKGVAELIFKEENQPYDSGNPTARIQKSLLESGAHFGHQTKRWNRR